MQFVYYTFAALVLYLLSDWLLVKIEKYRGQAFAQRSLVFFAIILVLAVSSFRIIELLVNQ